MKYVVCLSRGCDECCLFCLNFEACSCWCSCMGSVSVSSSCQSCIFVFCVHLVAVLDAAFCIICSFLMLVNHASATIWKSYTRAGLITALCRGLCTCTEMLWMCVLYTSFRSKVRPRTSWCVPVQCCLFCGSDCSHISHGLE